MLAKVLPISRDKPVLWALGVRMRLIVQGVALAVAALVAFGVSGWFFLYEQALHAEGVVVKARIMAIRADRGAPRSLRDVAVGHGPLVLAHQTMIFAYTMPDGRQFVTPHQVLLDYTVAHHVGDAVLLRVNPVQPLQFEVYDQEFAGSGFVAGAIAMILAVGAAVSFWLAYGGLLERAQAAAAAQMPRPKARLRRVYMRRP